MTLGDTASRDANQVTALLGTSSTDGKTVSIYADPNTHRLKVDTGSSGATAATWGGSGGNTTTVTDPTVTTASFIGLMFATPPTGASKGVVCSNGSFIITSSDAESSSLAFTYKVFP